VAVSRVTLSFVVVGVRMGSVRVDCWYDVVPSGSILSVSYCWPDLVVVEVAVVW